MKCTGEHLLRHTLACLAGLAVASTTVACSGRDENAVNPNAPTRESTARIMTPPENAPAIPPPRLRPRPMAQKVAPLGPAPTEYVIEEPAPALAAAEAPHERDFSEELRNAVGDIASCLDVETARTLHGALTVSVSTTVLPSGTMSRASVSAPLPEAARNCIRDRALHASIGPVENAPRSISTTLRFEVQASEAPPPQRVFAPDYIPPGATAPGVTLPALGGAPPAGAQAPGIVLPAQVP